MILRPQSLETFKTLNHTNYNFSLNSNDLKKKIQNYTFLPNDKIGRGYSSIVYKGEHQTTKQPVAIKVIDLKSLKDDNTKRFLQNELECLRKLNNQNNLRYINSFMTSNNCYIITELYSEGDLGKILKQKIRFSQIQTFQIFSQIYQGYLHFHSKGYIHRDIKPSNILIRKNIQKTLYVIADFGFVKNLSQNPRDSFNVGTPVYMSPESISSNIYTVKSDIWSIGVMLFELLYGFLPFQSKSQIQLKKQICNKQIKLHQIQQASGTYASPEFKSFLLSCLRKNPQNRIPLQDMAEHAWLRKFTSYDLKLRTAKSQFQNNRRQIISKSKDKISTEQINFGYIGNQPIRRQKSLQAKDYRRLDKNMRVQAMDFSVQKHRQKSKVLFLLSNNTNEPQKPSQRLIDINKSDLYGSNKMNNLGKNLSYSCIPKVNIIEEKSQKISSNTCLKAPEPRSSIFQGMKEIISLKNNQILKINSDVCNKKSKNQRQGYFNNENFNKENFRNDIAQNNNIKSQLQLSTSIEQNTCDSVQRQKNKNEHSANLSPVWNGFKYTLPLVVRYKNELADIQNSNPNINQRIINKNVNMAQERLTEQRRSGASVIPSISPSELLLKSLHTLRYVFETLSLLNDFSKESQKHQQKYRQAKQCLLRFFSIQFLKMKTCILTKANIFKIPNWFQFIETDGFATFVQVIHKYDIKYCQSSHQGLQLNSAKKIEQLADLDLQQYQTVNYQLLRQVEEVNVPSKQITKRSLNDKVTSGLSWAKGKIASKNNQIILIYNLHKCLSIVAATIQANNRQLTVQIDPKKELEQMTCKTKDPFKIAKILIQLKKKLMAFDADPLTYRANHKMEIGTQFGKNQVNTKSNNESVRQ